MKMIKKICLLGIMLTMAVNLCACGTKKFNHEKFADVLEASEFEEYEDGHEFLKNIAYLSNSQSYYYQSGDEADEMYDTLINRSLLYSDYKIKELTTAYMNKEEGYMLIYMITFESNKDAESFFEECAAKDYEKTGNQDGYEYLISKKENTNSISPSSVYLIGDTILQINGKFIDTKTFDNICNMMELVNPVDIL